MIKRLLKWSNDNHWYIIAGLVMASMMFWTYGCVSTVSSVMYPDKQINRSELETELQYLVSTVQNRIEDLDRQDAIKQSLLDAANVVASTGTINPSGLINLAATIGAIGFGLNRNQALKKIKNGNGA